MDSVQAGRGCRPTGEVGGERWHGVDLGGERGRRAIWLGGGIWHVPPSAYQCLCLLAVVSTHTPHAPVCGPPTLNYQQQYCSTFESLFDYAARSINMFSFPFPLHSPRRRREFEPKGNTRRNPKSCLCQHLSIQGPLCSIPRTLTSTTSPARTKNHSHR